MQSMKNKGMHINLLGPPDNSKAFKIEEQVICRVLPNQNKGVYRHKATDINIKANLPEGCGRVLAPAGSF